ncbi:toxic anion resistance protein [Bordetella ansorpii]|uniref:toxic anion resistance protein n=1 Tax=Bordetella ansorpii TaxID=288768 RepID=UPI000AE41E77|nr:toxic anion resistance protein [Bordetella ansorpii]
MEQQTQTLTPPDMVLTPPEVIQPVEQKKATDMVALPDETTSAIDRQVASVVETLFTEDVHSDTFKSRVDALFHLGRNEISNASELMTGRFMERNFVGIEDSAAFKAIQSMRAQLDELNPGREGDLLSPRKLLGLIPFGNKLRDYFRKFQDAGDHLKAIMADLHRARATTCSATRPRSTSPWPSCGTPCRSLRAPSPSPRSWTPRCPAASTP